MRKPLATLVAATTFAGLGLAGQSALPGFVTSAQAQNANAWTFRGPAPDTQSPTATPEDKFGDQSGRLDRVVTVPDDPSTIFVGSAGGGVWKSTDSGATWSPKNDFTNSSVRTGSSEAIGSLWVDKTGQTLYAGTGELDSGNSTQFGTGLLKSTDSGETWTPYAQTRTALAGTKIGGVVANQAGTTVFAATDKGLYKADSNVCCDPVTNLTNQIPSIRPPVTDTFTSNGTSNQTFGLRNRYRGVGAVVKVDGVTWRQVSNFDNSGSGAEVYTLKNDPSFPTLWDITFGNNVKGKIPPNGAIITATYDERAPSGQVWELQQDPKNPMKLWASFGDNCSTEEGGIATSADFGTTWTRVFSETTIGRISVGVANDGTAGSAPGDGAKTAYGGISSCTGTLNRIQKSTEGGKLGSWNPVKGTVPSYGPQGNFNNVTAVDPTDANRAAFGGVQIITTEDGGDNFTNASAGKGIHPDFHAFQFTGAKTFYAGNDGGLYKTTNMGGTGKPTDWTNLNGGTDPTKRLATVQFYGGTAATASTDLFGGTQDNGSAFGPNGTPGLPAMSDIAGGDGGYAVNDPTNTGLGNNFFYGELPNLRIQRVSGTPPALSAPTRISPCTFTANRCVNGPVDDPVGFVAPFVEDPLDPQILTGTTAAGSAQVMNVSSLVGLRVGEPISGSSIPADTTILLVGTNWAASKMYSMGDTVVGAGHTQKATNNGTSGTTQPTWNTSGGTTHDGTVVWQDEGPTSAKVMRLSKQATATGSASFTAGGGRLLAGSARVWETTNARSCPSPGPSCWRAISPRLTRDSEDFLSFISQAYSSTGSDTVFTTSDDGKVFRTTNASVPPPNEPTWTDITGNLPEPSQTTFNGLAFLTSVTFNPSNTNEAWVTVGRLARPGQNVGQVYHTTNADKGASTTWTNISPTVASKALPPAPVFSVVKEPNSSTIDVGTYFGAWQCIACEGSTTDPNWQRLGSTTPPSLPINVMVRELTVSQDNKSLVAWTFGRGIWTIPLS